MDDAYEVWLDQVKDTLRSINMQMDVVVRLSPLPTRRLSPLHRSRHHRHNRFDLRPRIDQTTQANVSLENPEVRKHAGKDLLPPLLLCLMAAPL